MPKQEDLRPYMIPDIFINILLDLDLNNTKKYCTK
ncbi:hypothetical protein REISMN_01270 [Rickettsia tamurae subsp. buchneri]|uniref:Uncharacterized protein n=1 Tax=Rickettsia tamurae subsp. buchneri TaxID=1462938 RepID=A0A8E0WMS1_9RICK|nr:hypothetical protein REISMN_01270 [Rickettsia tamurae subsp. buchneri]